VPARPPLTRALLHVVLAWGLGVCAALLGTPALVASLFGGPVALLLTLGVLTAVVAALAVVAVPPGRHLGARRPVCTATALSTPEGDQPTTACTRVDGDRWLRSTDLRQELLPRRDGVWVGVTTPRDVPQALLDQALAGARPTSEDEYEAWLDEVLP
jgi:hypothetical protein